jgi:von Willebrand factor type D domain
MQVVTVLLNKERIEVNAEQMKVKVNDMELSLKDIYVVKDAENKIVAQIRRTADNFVEVDAPAHLIRVTCDAKEVSIAGSPVHRGRLCGLCGSATGNKMTDLTGPRKNPLTKELMSAAYELQRPAGCKSVKVPEIRRPLLRVQAQHVEEKKSSIFGITDAQPLLPRFQQTVVSMHVPRIASQCTLLRNKMVTRDEKRCFSTVSLPKCSEGCKPVNMVEQKVRNPQIPILLQVSNRWR